MFKFDHPVKAIEQDFFVLLQFVHFCRRIVVRNFDSVNKFWSVSIPIKAQY